MGKDYCLIIPGHGLSWYGVYVFRIYYVKYTNYARISPPNIVFYYIMFFKFDTIVWSQIEENQLRSIISCVWINGNNRNIGL